MKICKTIAEARAACREARELSLATSGSTRLALVPTMGALHEGHLSLVRTAASGCAVAASIFVNPTQFGPAEDFAKYPRTFEADCAALEKEGVDIVFAPTPEEMYPPGASTWVTVEGLSDRLDGRSRPGHFRGVTTVVSKLFHIIQPDIAFFGQKDAAQVAVIRRMVRDLNFPIEIVACPIVREPDGLALSSRNIYLNKEDRRRALVLHRSLQEVEKEFRAGEISAEHLAAKGREVISGERQVRLDYFEIVDPDTLEPVGQVAAPALVAVAAFVGPTRLIDNIVLRP
jgi:pantoate--beta-alanine ligase